MEKGRYQNPESLQHFIHKVSISGKKNHQTTEKQENEIHGQEKKQSKETSPGMAQMLHLAKILKQLLQHGQIIEVKYSLNKRTD